MRPAWTGTFVLDSLLTRTTRYTSSTPRASRLRSRNRLRPIHRDGRTRRIRRSARSSSISLHGLGQRAWIRSSIRRSTSAGSEADQRFRSRRSEDGVLGLVVLLVDRGSDMEQMGVLCAAADKTPRLWKIFSVYTLDTMLLCG